MEPMEPLCQVYDDGGQISAHANEKDVVQHV